MPPAALRLNQAVCNLPPCLPPPGLGLPPPPCSMQPVAPTRPPGLGLPPPPASSTAPWALRVGDGLNQTRFDILMPSMSTPPAPAVNQVCSYAK